MDAWVKGEKHGLRHLLSPGSMELWVTGCSPGRPADESEDDVARDIVDEIERAVATMAEPAGHDRVLAQTQYGPDLNAQS